MLQYDLWIKIFHLISMIVWMAGLFYLPRLFVYHAKSTSGTEQSETFKTMEKKLLKIIMNPAMLATWITGILFAIEKSVWFQGWFYAKIVLVLLLTGYHMTLGQFRKHFENDINIRSHIFYRFYNEVPTLLMIGIIIVVILQQNLII